MMRSSSVDRSAGVRAVWGGFSGTSGLITNAGSGDWGVTKSAAGLFVVTVTPGFKTNPTCGGNSASFGVLGFVVMNYNQVQVYSWIPNTGAALDAITYFRFEGKPL